MNKKYISSFLILILILSLIISNIFMPIVSAEQNQKEITNKPIAIQIDEASVKRFFDDTLEKQFSKYHIPGATVSVVKNGEHIFTKGYGYADTEKDIPVDAEKTLFRVASISKLFVWTAVMQLVEQGKLDLNKDINDYTGDLKIPLRYDKPITLLDLMNHTSGFEERAIGESVASSDKIRPLNEYLSSHMPQQVRPSGELTAYSNYGASLAGYIVGRVSGIPFERYVENFIFNPLEMEHSSFEQPLQSNLVSDIAVGYTLQNENFISHDFEWKQSAPAGAMSSTAKDIANFMIAHLQEGSFNNKRILKEETALQMHKRSFTNDPKVNGIAHGFMEATINNKRILFHGGDIFHFHSILVLIPDDNVGFFISFNNAESMLAVQEVLKAFMDEFYPLADDTQPKDSEPESNMNQYSGTYMPARHEYTTLGKILGLFQSVQVQRESENNFKVTLGLPTPLSYSFVAKEPFVLKSSDTPEPIFGDIVFGTEQNGNIKYMYQQNNPATAYIKLPWYGELVFNLVILGLCLITFILVIIWGMIVIFKRTRKGHKWSREEWIIFLNPVIVSLLSIGFITGLGILFSNQEIVFGMPPWSKYLSILPWCIGILSLSMVVTTIRALINGRLSVYKGIFYIIITSVYISFNWFIIYWNLWVSKA